MEGSGGGDSGATEPAMPADHQSYPTIAGPDAPAGAASTKRGPGPVSRLGKSAHSTTRPRRRLRRSSGWQHLVTSDLFLGLVLAVLAWPTSTKSLVATVGLDSSWRAAITMATHSHMAFGSHVVFPYGPLGFLVAPALYFASTAILAFIFTLAFSAGLFGTLVWSLRRTIPLPLAVAAAYIVGGISRLSADSVGINVAVEDVVAVVLIACVFVISCRPDDRAPVWIWISLGGVLSFLSLIKIGLAVAIGASIVITVACLHSGRRRAVGWLTLGAVPVFCLGWFGTGNGFQNMIAFAKSAVAVTSGYGAAMSTGMPPLWYSYWLAGFASVLICVFAVAHSRGLARQSRIGIGLVTLISLWFLFKEGFVRHDPTHDTVFFVAAPLLLAAFLPPWRSKAWLVAGMLSLTFVTTSVVGSIPESLTQPVQATQNFVNEAIALASSPRRLAIIAKSRRLLRADYGLPNEMVAAMRGQTVDVSPWEQTVVWAFPDLHFDPLPVIQDYGAYTPSLDQLDTDYLASPNAPRYILRQPTQAIDGKDPAFEPPATQLAIECRYREVAANPTWQLLQRRNDRCGHVRRLGETTTGLDQRVTVPAAPGDDEVVASFNLPDGLWSKLESLLYKPPNVFFTANDGKETWRFVTATGPDMHILRTSSALGYSPAFVPLPIRNLEFSIAGAGPSTSGITVTFYAVPMS